MMHRGDVVRVRVGARAARKATVVAKAGWMTYLVEYENGELENVRQDAMELIQGGDARKNETGVQW